MSQPIEAEHEFLWWLLQGCTYAESVQGVSGGAKAAVECHRKGWLAGGRLTKAGRELAEKPRKTTRFQITIVPISPGEEAIE